MSAEGPQRFPQPDRRGTRLRFRFKKGELSVDKGGTVLAEGTRNPHLYTILSGWAFRYKLLSDGRRQIVNFAMPGDMIGLQGTLMGEMQHSVEALVADAAVRVRARGVDVALQGPPRPRLRRHLDRGARGIDPRREPAQRRPPQRAGTAAYLAFAFIAERARDVGLFDGADGDPITQQHLADTLGLSLVHTNKTVRKLAQKKLLRWREGGCEVLDLERLKDPRRLDAGRNPPRPFI
jgi:CRP/FNR family transcriptional regulator, anaerobic regulatory protein